MLTVNGIEVTGELAPPTSERIINTVLDVLVSDNGGIADITVEVGRGTNHIIQTYCEAHNFEFREVRMSMMDPFELLPLPYVDLETKAIKLALVDPLKVLNIGDQFTVVVLDDFDSAPPSIQLFFQHIEKIPGVVILRKFYFRTA